MEGTENGIRRIGYDDPTYPQRLKPYPGMPKLLYVLGSLPKDDSPTAAIVGARQCSVYGRMQAFRYAKCLSEAGVQIISGLAYGIDAEAHKGALEGAAPTFAVLGSGVDVCYPSSNLPLYRRIQREGGGILSEFEPGVKARNYHFPIRNRIISALADILLVVEAKDKSGSLITARYALDQGKSVYALPGSVTEELSLGCHKLIYDGAGIAYSPEILLEELGISGSSSQKLADKFRENKELGLESDLKLLYSCLDLRPKTPDMLLKETNLSVEQLNRLLMELELLGMTKEVFRHHYVKVNET
jgi:DNA processing protein